MINGLVTVQRWIVSGADGAVKQQGLQIRVIERGTGALLMGATLTEETAIALLRRLKSEFENVE